MCCDILTLTEIDVKVSSSQTLICLGPERFNLRLLFGAAALVGLVRLL
jgi:hypothetical protein